MTQRWKKALSVMLCAAIITSGGLIAFAEGETEENQPELQQIDQGYGVSETVTAAIAALEDLPELDSLNEQTDADALLAQVKEARAAVEALTEEEKAALCEDAADLMNKLDELEFFFANRPVTAPEDQAVETLNDEESMETAVSPEDAVCKIGENYYATLEEAVESATDGDTVILTKPVTLNTGCPEDSNYKLWIDKSLVIDGQGNTVTTTGRGIGIEGGSTESDTKLVVLRNITIINSDSYGRAVSTRGGHLSLKLQHATLETTGSGNTQALTVGGNHDYSINVDIADSTLKTGDAGYAVIVFNPVNMTIDHSTLSGYAALYLKGQNSSAGSAGSEITVQNGSNLSSVNPNPEKTDSSFGTVVFEDGNIKLDIVDSTVTCHKTGTVEEQSVIDFSQDASNNTVTISGNSVVTANGADTSIVKENGKTNSTVIKGGSFNQSVEEYVSPELKYEVKDKNGMYTYHTTKDEAIHHAAANGGGTVTGIGDDNKGEIIEVPAGGNPSTPTTPNNPSTGGSSTVQQMEEREKPDPADKKAVEAYNFWKEVKAKIRSAKDGKMLKISVVQSAEYMPASVMQTLYERKNVGLTLYWNENTIVIPAGKAMPKQPMKAYWTVKKLTELY